MTIQQRSTFLSLCLSVALGTAPIACKDEPTSSTTSGGTGGTHGTDGTSGTHSGACRSDECPEGELFWYCEYIHENTFGYPEDDGYCAPDEQDAQEQCLYECIFELGPVCVAQLLYPEPCAGYIGSAPPRACHGWDPGGAVTQLQPGVYEVDQDFYFDLLDNPGLLVWCDAARMVAISGGFRWEDITTGDLASELGFENGDIPLSVNGNPLTTLSEAADAFYNERNSSDFTVVLQRGASQLSHYYIVR